MENNVTNNIPVTETEQDKPEKIDSAETIKANDIKNRFKKKSRGRDGSSQVSEILSNAEQREKIYAEEGQRRAEETIVAKEVDEKKKKIYKRTTVQLQLTDLARYMDLEKIALLEGQSMTYEVVIKAGLDYLETLNEQQLRKKIIKYKTKE